MSLAVALWPTGLERSARLHLIGLATTGLTRPQASAKIRQTLADALAALALPARLATGPAEVPRLILPDGKLIGLSISHAEGLSIAAIALDGAVGVDVARREDLPEALAVARDYLGPEIAQALCRAPERERSSAFAQAWTAQEARLKCLGLPLTEWSPELETRLRRCAAQPLALPEGWVGALAMPM